MTPVIPDGDAGEVQMIDRSDVLMAMEEIRALKARYFRLMDSKDWDRWRELFTPDVVMDIQGEKSGLKSLGFDCDETAEWVLRGRDVLVSSVSSSLEGVTTVHHGHMSEITIESPNAASGVWALEDILRYPPGAPVAGFHGYGHYHETYCRVGGQWRIRSIKLTRLLITPVPWG